MLWHHTNYLIIIINNYMMLCRWKQSQIPGQR